MAYVMAVLVDNSVPMGASYMAILYTRFHHVLVVISVSSLASLELYILINILTSD
jgi:hypothetical protein